MNIHQPAWPSVAVTIAVTLVCLAFVAYVWLTTFGPLAKDEKSGPHEHGGS